jgi:hypothetical protein
MTFDPFADPLLKIERAREHVAALNEKINAYLLKRPFRAVVRQQPYLCELQLAVETKLPIPKELSLIIGDVVHNLRSSLDIMMFGLIGHKVSRPEKLYFPFPKKDTREAIEGAITGAQVHLAGPRIVAAIKSLEPHPNGKYGLYGLHELDVTDKHKLILPAWRNTEITQAQLKEIHPLFDCERPDDMTLNFRMPRDKAVLVATRFQPSGPSWEIEAVQFEAKIQPTFVICFDQSQPFAFEPVIPSLADLATITEIAVTTVKLAFQEGLEQGETLGLPISLAVPG